MSIREVRVDDIDGVTTEGVETYTFSWLAVDYTIDLSEKNAKKLLDVMATYAEKATQVGRSTAPRSLRAAASAPKATGSGYSKDELQAVRSWAAQAGIEVSPRGRIKQTVLDQYEADHKA